uniref:Type I-E CRISPR-associated protein Cse2/CasB n=2 Tax=Aromatoleum anaerobium TaxID=182180 RepID=A0ABX1PPX3_9RHOO
MHLAERDRGALAALRRSLAFDPGSYPPAFPFVERFVGSQRHTADPFRKALYVAAGLFALHPAQRADYSLAMAFGHLKLKRDSNSIEQRFITLLAADPENLSNYLRQAVSLLAADGIAFDYTMLLDDLTRWLNPYAHEQRDALRQRWARDFYRALAPREAGEDAVPDSSTITE